MGDHDTVGLVARREYGIVHGELNRRIKESPPSVNWESLRPHSPLAREDLKPLGSEWSPTIPV